MCIYGALILVCMWSSIWAAAPDKEEAYTLGALIEQSKLMPYFDTNTVPGQYIAYQVGQDAWRIGKLHSFGVVVCEIDIVGKTKVPAARGNLRTIRGNLGMPISDAKPLDK